MELPFSGCHFYGSLDTNLSDCHIKTIGLSLFCAFPCCFFLAGGFVQIIEEPLYCSNHLKYSQSFEISMVLSNFNENINLFGLMPNSSRRTNAERLTKIIFSLDILSVLLLSFISVCL